MPSWPSWPSASARDSGAFTLEPVDGSSGKWGFGGCLLWSLLMLWKQPLGGLTVETNDSHSSKQPSWRAGGGRGMLALKPTDNSCRTQFVKGSGVSDLRPDDNSPKKHPREGSIYPGAYQ